MGERGLLLWPIGWSECCAAPRIGEEVKWIAPQMPKRVSKHPRKHD